ncbi:MAG: HAD family hydrolase [Eubacterium sp.]|nr:HAD family hydrolase [Eubacterium sp.]
MQQVNVKFRRIIFLDIDGTLTKPGSNDVPKSAVWAIRQARKEGHYVFLCTGRNYAMLRPVLKYGFDGIIGSSGGYVECHKNVIFDCPMTPEQSRSVRRVLNENGIFSTIECMDASYTDTSFRDFLRSHAAEGKNSELLRWREQLERSLHIKPLEEYQGEPIYKIVFAGTSMEALARAQESLEDFDFCIQERDGSGMIHGEVVNKAFDKGRAVERVCRYLELPLDSAIAIGDSMNDLEMLQTAGLGICMKNGSEKLKSVADDICPAFHENGIRTAFIKHRLIYTDKLREEKLA